MTEKHHLLSRHANRESILGALKQGDLQLAEGVLCGALKDNEKCGELELSLVEHANTLAVLYCRERNYVAAERIYRAVLEAQEKLLGSNNPDIIDSLEKLAIIVKETSGNMESMSLAYRAFSLRGQVKPS